MRTRAAAARIRRKHEQTIAEQPDQRRRVWRAFSWVLAELKARPDHTDHAIEALTNLARDLNERSIR